MRQASGSHGPLTPGTQTGHLRRESTHSTQSDVSNQGPAAPGRGGFQPQGGRGRGGNNFNPQYPHQPQMGFPPNPPPFRNQPNSGRGGIPPPFQPQGRPMNPPFPNSAHQAARSPALTNSIPGTPNMGQSMPMQNQSQYNPNFYNAQMQSQPVNYPSTSNNRECFNSNNGGKANDWRKNEQSSESRGSSEQSRELWGHSVTSDEQMPPECEGYGHKDMKNAADPMEHSESGAYLQQEQLNAPKSPGSSERRRSSIDLSSFPPLPPVIPCNLPPTPPTAFSPQFGSYGLSAKQVLKLDLSPQGNGFNQFLTMRQNYGYPPQPYDRMGMSMQGAPMMYPQMQNMQHMYQMGQQPPASPQPNFQQPNTYMTGQYGPQAPTMSRNSSQMSEHRPASSLGGGPSTPSLTPSVSHGHTPQHKASPAATTPFSRPRKNAAIQIKRPDGEALDVESLKAPASPAPRDRARTPPVIASTPTPPPKSSTPQHNRTDSSVTKSKADEEARKLAFKETIQKAAQANNSETKAEDDAKRAEDAKAKAEVEAKEQAKAAEEAKAKEELEAKAAAEKKKQEEEEEIERQIQEMEEAEARREKEEQEMNEKRAAEKKAAAAAEEERRKANAAEEDAKLREQEREMERLEDERERKRAEAEAKAQGGSQSETKEAENKGTAAEDKNGLATPNTLASKLSNLTLGTDSGASTPASDDSMPPPPKVSAAEKRGKPAALKLEPLNTKPVEPPQPSAALQSLKSARFLRVIDSSIYPPNISSPNPALNSAVTTKGKSFKYDKEFLLQFQKVFTEKPSLEFESQIKALIGDPNDAGSARSASTRSGSGMGPRQGSNRNPPGPFDMGSFAAGSIGAGKTLPPGTTSAERFAMASGAIPRPTGNPMTSFNRPGGSFPGGSSMQRTPSSLNLSSMPHSPRQQSRSQRGNSKRDNYQGNAKQEAQAAKTMPLTAGMDLKPIQVSASGWKPRSVGANQSVTGAAGPAPGASGGHMEPDMVQRKVKAALNKMTPEKFDKIADQILSIAAQSKDEADGRTLRQVIQLTFEKATDEAHWAGMYAKFCKRMLETMSPEIKDESILDKNGNIVSGGNLFRKYLLNRCQEEFERGWKIDLPEKPEGERGEEKTEEAAMLSDEYYIAAAAKRRGLGLVQFIGELYKLSMLTERIMHECVKKLVDYTGIPDEAEIESLTKLLKTIGSNLDSTEKGKPMMDVYFSRIQGMIDTPELPSRLRFMLMDIIDLRKKNWMSKEDNKGPKTLEQVRAEVSLARVVTN